VGVLDVFWIPVIECRKLNCETLLVMLQLKRGLLTLFTRPVVVAAGGMYIGAGNQKACELKRGNIIHLPDLCRIKAVDAVVKSEHDLAVTCPETCCLGEIPFLDAALIAVNLK